jgi:hypothetical protein
LTCGFILDVHRVFESNLHRALVTEDDQADKPKMLRGLSQKLRDWCRSSCTTVLQTKGHRLTGGVHPTRYLQATG